MYAIQAENGNYLSSLFSDSLKDMFAEYRPIKGKVYLYNSREVAQDIANDFEKCYEGLKFIVIEVED